VKWRWLAQAVNASFNMMTMMMIDANSWSHHVTNTRSRLFATPTGVLPVAALDHVTWTFANVMTEIHRF